MPSNVGQRLIRGGAEMDGILLYGVWRQYCEIGLAAQVISRDERQRHKISVHLLDLQ